jgi:tetratricopeptide (TPR) repeat protein
MPDKTVFLSSTAGDLEEYREAVYHAIPVLDGWKCVRMEDFGARDWEADEFCRAKVKECDVMVGIVGHCHGSCPPRSDQSYTEREYEAAVAANVPRLMFFAPENFPLPANLIEPDKKRQKQRAFRERVSNERIRDTFTTRHDLAWRVVAAIRNWEQEHPKAEAETLIRALDRLLWPTASGDSATAGFRDKKHDGLLSALRVVLDAHFGARVRVSIFQSLPDAGCDIGLLFPAQGLKCGIQVKSHRDIAQLDFATKTLAQIQDSRRHGLRRLYLVLAGDLTDPSQLEKVRGLDSRISQMQDDYVTVVPPERVWTLLCEPPPAPSAAARPAPSAAARPVPSAAARPVPSAAARPVPSAAARPAPSAAARPMPSPARVEGVMPLPPQPYFAHTYPLQEHFTGRARERRMLTQWLKADDHPVLALIAIGGMGKSALTWAWLQRDVLGLPLPGQPKDPPDVAAACRLPADARPEGVLWWSFYEREAGCAAFLDEALTYASGGQVDPRQISSDYDKLRELIALLERRRLLLVLDGLERELRAYASLSAAYQGDALPKDVQGDPNSCTDPHAADFLRQVAALAGGSRVLITSRLFPRELDGAAGCRREELIGLAPEDAVAFFRAQGVKKGTRAEIEAACASYGYLPLALRLLAGVIVHDKRMPGDIRVAGRHPVLAELKGKEQHHILEVAYNALDEQKQGLLSGIAAFRSPMTYDALSILNEYGSETEFDAALQELIDRGLLFRAGDRYDLHPIVRQYAYGRLGDKKGVHSRLRDYFAAVPALEKDKVRSLEDLAPVIELYHHTVGAGRFDEACSLLRDRLVPDPLHFRFGAYQAMIQLKRALFPDGEDLPPRLKKKSDQGWTLNALANSYSFSGQPRNAVRAFEGAVGLAGKLGNKKNVAIGLGNLALDQVRLGELAAAEASLRRSVELSREVGDEFGEAVGHLEVGRLLAYRGASHEAAQELDAALASFEKLTQPQSQCIVWAYRALRALLMGDAEAARAAARQARELADEVARTVHPFERDIIRAEWLLGAALVALASGNKERQDEALAEAERHLTEALNRCRRINMVDYEPDILLAWARWHRARGNAPQAQEHAEEALAIADRCEYRLAQADAHNLLARLALEAGDQPAARQHAQIAKERAECDGPPHCYQPALDEAERLLKAAP